MASPPGAYEEDEEMVDDVFITSSRPRWRDSIGDRCREVRGDRKLYARSAAATPCAPGCRVCLCGCVSLLLPGTAASLLWPLQRGISAGRSLAGESSRLLLLSCVRGPQKGP